MQRRIRFAMTSRIDLHIGFTGTQQGLTILQFAALERLVIAVAGEVDFDVTPHHGDCIGADQAFHTICEDRRQCLRIPIIHPPLSTYKRAFCPGRVLPPRPYLERNRDIVDQSDWLIAAPDSDKERVRSGTWSTVRYARKQLHHIIFVYPDGSIVKERPHVDQVQDGAASW